MQSSRTSNSIKNSSVAAITQIVTIILTFGMQSVFISTLGTKYLGLNGLFSNILSVLSFAELGIGTAITFSLYKPLAEGNREIIIEIMNFFRRTYESVGILILALGLLLTPFLSVFIKDSTEVQFLHLYFILFLLNTVVSYFFSYKRTLLIANQQGYLSTVNIFIFKVIQTIIQIIFLFIFHSFIAYLLIQIFFTLISNLRISKIADKIFPYLKENKKTKIDLKLKNQIKRDTIGMVGAKLGGIVVGNTNNLLISSFVGLVTVGMYSSYIMVINGIQSVIKQLLDAMTASIGNLLVEENAKKSMLVFDRHFFLTFIISFYSANYLISLFNNFVSLWLGKDMVFSFHIVLLLVINFYIEQMRGTFSSFITTFGLFTQNGKKSVFEAILNLVVCLVLLIKFNLGVVGVLFGTTIVHLVVNIWYEPWLVYHAGFKRDLPIKYFVKYLFFAFVTVLSSTVNVLLIQYFGNGNSIQHLILGFIQVSIVSTILFMVFFGKREETKFFLSFVNKIIKKIIKR